MSRATSGRDRTLFEHLVDDAAVFPPGLAPTDVAVTEHLSLRDGPYAAGLGPLLLPATSAGELAHLAARDRRARARPLEVGLIVRPEADLDPLGDAVALLADEPGVRVTSVEVGWSPEWRRTLELGVPVVVEVGLGRDQEAGLDDLADAAARDGVGRDGVGRDGVVRAKFRTGHTPGWAWPDEPTLAGFLGATVARGLSFKLTGGLHHVVRDDHGSNDHGSNDHGSNDHGSNDHGSNDRHDPMHGVLNVLLATHETLHGADTHQVTAILEQRSTELLVDGITRLTPEDAARVRASFTAYGCCGVMDPLSELEALGLFVPAG